MAGQIFASLVVFVLLVAALYRLLVVPNSLDRRILTSTLSSLGGLMFGSIAYLFRGPTDGVLVGIGWFSMILLSLLPGSFRADHRQRLRKLLFDESDEVERSDRAHGR